MNQPCKHDGNRGANQTVFRFFVCMIHQNDMFFRNKACVKVKEITSIDINHKNNIVRGVLFSEKMGYHEFNTWREHNNEKTEYLFSYSCFSRITCRL